MALKHLLNDEDVGDDYQGNYRSHYQLDKDDDNSQYAVNESRLIKARVTITGSLRLYQVKPGTNTWESFLARRLHNAI
jgi:hypothetical protein